MPEACANYLILIFVQFVLFLLHAWYSGRLNEVPKLLGQGIVCGLFVGLLFDLALGKYLGMFSYTFGFGVTSLLVNAATSYGIFAADLLLLDRVGQWQWTGYVLLIVLVYETINLFCPVWIYHFDLFLIQFLVLCFVGYSAGALAISFLARMFFKRTFFFNRLS